MDGSSKDSQSNSKDAQTRIAVIAVHGVADQKPFQTQQATANLLLTGSTHKKYSDFIEKQINIPQNEVTLAREIDFKKSRKQCRGLRSLHTTGLVNRLAAFEDSKIIYKSDADADADADARSDCTSPAEGSLTSTKTPDAPKSATDSVHVRSVDELTEHEAMREQLQGFTHDIDAGTINIKVLSGKRTGSQNEQDSHIDLYEMHWADLSRISEGFFSFFFEFYLLLYFLPRIGTQTLERSRPFDKDKGYAWKIAFISHIIAESILVVIVPVLQLCVLSICVVLLPLHFNHPKLILPAGYSISFLLILVAVGAIFVFVFFKLGRKHNSHWNIFAVPVIITLISVVAVFINFKISANWNSIFTHLLFCLVLMLLLYIYDKRQPGALVIGAILLTLTFSLTTLLQLNGEWVDWIVQGLKSQPVTDLVGDTIRTGLATASYSSEPYQVTPQRIFYVGITALFLVANCTAIAIAFFIFCTLVSYLAGAWAADHVPEEDKPRCKRLFWTSNTTLILSGMLTILITFSLWELFYRASVLAYQSNPNLNFVPHILRIILETQFFPGITIIAVVLLTAIFYAAWSIIPAPLSDLVNKPGNNQDLGELLDRSFRHMNYASWAITAIFFIVIPVAAYYRIAENPVVTEIDHYVVLGIGLFTVILQFGKGPAAPFKKGFGAVLDIALDVTNWFRVLPRKNNAKAAICRRYVSLLRHISNWRDPISGKPYDGLVIVAHSQGTVITADLLRFLVHEQSLGSAPTDLSLSPFFPQHGSPAIPISLLTFGSPLRQLYNKRFPHQYAWCESNAHKNGADPALLGVNSWHNIYMSGDYVGRYLWNADNDPSRFDTENWMVKKSHCDSSIVSERCGGFGGHTGYWSGRVPLVSDTIDELISRIATSSATLDKNSNHTHT